MGRGARAARLVLRFPSLSHFIRARNEWFERFVPGAERSDLNMRLARHSKNIQPDFWWFQNYAADTHKIHIRLTSTDVSSGLDSK